MVKKSALPPKSFMSYVSNLKKKWGVAVYDPNTGKRAVAESLTDAVEKLNKTKDIEQKTVAEEIIIIDSHVLRNSKSFKKASKPVRKSKPSHG